MREFLGQLLDRLLSAPDLVVYLVLGVLAALENVVPPVPADVVVLFGAVLAGRRQVDPWAVFFIVWLANVLGALMVYAVGRSHGTRFFAGRWGSMLLRPGQLASLGAFYRRFGFGVIFVSRFLPMLRAVVPPFAGVAGLGFWRTAIPIAAASAIWYGLIVYLGYTFGSNWEEILAAFRRSGRWTSWVAALTLIGIAVWWWRSRNDESEEG